MDPPISICRQILFRGENSHGLQRISNIMSPSVIHILKHFCVRSSCTFKTLLLEFLIGSAIWRINWQYMKSKMRASSDTAIPSVPWWGFISQSAAPNDQIAQTTAHINDSQGFHFLTRWHLKSRKKLTKFSWERNQCFLNAAVTSWKCIWVASFYMMEIIMLFAPQTFSEQAYLRVRIWTGKDSCAKTNQWSIISSSSYRWMGKYMRSNQALQ